MHLKQLVSGFMAILILLLIPACSSNLTNSPVTPDFQKQTDNHALLGSFRVRIDLQTETATSTPIRNTDKHYDVTAWLMPPTCSDCFQISVQEIDWPNLELTADVTIKNFTTGLTGYDVRGIVYPLGDYVLKNAHAYTLLFAPIEVNTPAGFRAYDTADPSRAMSPQESAMETFVIGFPSGAGFIDLIYAIDASWPNHCPEPYDICCFEQNNLGEIPGSTAQVTVYVSDWQGDTSKVTIDTSFMGGLELNLDHVTGEIWSGEVTNVLGLPANTYPAMVTGRDSATLNHLFQWVDLKIVDTTDTDPPVWDTDVGITSVSAGMTGVLVKFGTASDPNGPVTYNLYSSPTTPIDFDTASVIENIPASPYLLEGLSPLEHHFCVRAVDDPGNETTNTAETSATVGLHPNVYWQDGPVMPTARGFSGGFYTDGGFWVLGGSSSGTMFNSVEVFDTDTEEWSSPWNLPGGRDAFACETLNGKAYIFGGRTAETVCSDSSLEILLSNGLINISLPPVPQELANHGSTVIGNIIYMTGGRHFTGSDWESHRQTYSFEPGASEFIGEIDMEFDSYGFGMTATSEYLLTVGGNPDRVDTMQNIPGAKSWVWMADLPSGRQHNNAVINDDWVYSIGGEAGWMPMPTVDVYNAETDTWYTIESLNMPRFGATSATDGDYIYVAGGFLHAGPATVPLNSLEIGKIF